MDTDLTDWLIGGAKVILTEPELAAKRASEFTQRFMLALNPTDDLGTTEEAAEAAKALLVYAVHQDLNALGEVVYSDVWQLINAPNRAAIKKYIQIARTSP